MKSVKLVILFSVLLCAVFAIGCLFIAKDKVLINYGGYFVVYTIVMFGLSMLIANFMEKKY